MFAELILHLQQQNRIDLNDKTALQVAEATQPVPQSSGNWTVVVHSYQSQNRTRAQRGACRTLLDIQESWPEGELKPEVEIYQTQISYSLAVTVGGFVSEADAKASADIIREYGIKDDAFAQVNRDWQETGISGSYLLEASGRAACDYFDEVQAAN